MKPKQKYDFETGKMIGRKKLIGYKYLGKGELGKIETIKVDGKTIYYLESFSLGIRTSPRTFDKSKFKKAEEWVENFDWGMKVVEKQKPQNKIEIETKIGRDSRDTLFSRDPVIKITKTDDINFFDVPKSILIKKLQLKKGDKLKITIEKAK